MKIPAGLSLPSPNMMTKANPPVTKPMKAIMQCVMTCKASTVTCKSAPFSLTCEAGRNAR